MDNNKLVFFLNDIDIFILNIAERVSQILPEIKKQLVADKVYALTVSFKVENIYDDRIDEIDLETKAYEKIVTREDKISNLLSSLIKKIDNRLVEHGINIGDVTIQGEKFDLVNVIKLQFEEQKSNTNPKSKITSIIVNLERTNDNLNEIFSKRYTEVFNNIMRILQNNKKTMSEILGIEVTDDINILFREFVKQYKYLMLSTNEDDKSKLLMNNLINKTLHTLKKY